jgi:hypothetical protein
MLLTYAKNLQDRISSLKRGGLSPYNYYSSQQFIEVHVPSQESERSCICVLGVSMLPLPTILIFDFGIDSTVWYFVFVFYYLFILTITFFERYFRNAYRRLAISCMSKFIPVILRRDKLLHWVSSNRPLCQLLFR